MEMRLWINLIMIKRLLFNDLYTDSTEQKDYCVIGWMFNPLIEILLNYLIRREDFLSESEHILKLEDLE